jgi:hypothetical protein
MTRWRMRHDPADLSAENVNRMRDNTVMKPLMPRKRADRFDLLGWWLDRLKRATYAGLHVVAVSHEISHDSAGRPERTFSWSGLVAVAKRARLKPENFRALIICKRGAEYMPSSVQMAEHYIKLYGDGMGGRQKRTRSEPDVVLHAAATLYDVIMRAPAVDAGHTN